MKLLGMGKYIKMGMGGLFSLIKKPFNGRTNSFGQIYKRGCFTWFLIIRSCKKGGKISQIHFPVI